jgi:hypothetical protein
MILTVITETFVNGELTEATTESMAWEDEGKQFHHNCNSPETRRVFRALGCTERATYGYTLAGYIVTRLTSVSPDKSEKTIRQFRIIREGEN